MKRRREPRALTVEDLPEHLREFDAAAWGWSGPHYDGNGYIVTGYHEAWTSYLKARHAWCDEHPSFDWLEEIRRRHPDEPWGMPA